MVWSFAAAAAPAHAASCTPQDFGNQFYYFRCTSQAFGEAFSQFRQEHPELEIASVASDGDANYGHTVGYFVIAKTK